MLVVQTQTVPSSYHEVALTQIKPGNCVAQFSNASTCSNTVEQGSIIHHQHGETDTMLHVLKISSEKADITPE